MERLIEEKTDTKYQILLCLFSIKLLIFEFHSVLIIKLLLLN